MTTELIVKPEWTDEQMKLITNTVAKGASPDELKLFLYRCKNLGLDPLKPGQIYFIKYGSSPGTIVVGLDGFRTRAAKTGKLSGIKRGVSLDDEGNLVSAWAEVYRSDWKECAREEVPVQEYDTGKGTWAKMKQTMLKKVAECAALRMAFPDELGGVYEQAEMDQAQAKSPVTPSQPEPGDGNTEPTHYTIPFGKFKQKSLEEVGVKELGSYVNYLEDQAKKKNESIKGVVADFIQRADEFIAAFENGIQGEEVEPGSFDE